MPHATQTSLWDCYGVLNCTNRWNIFARAVKKVFNLWKLLFPELMFLLRERWCVHDSNFETAALRAGKLIGFVSTEILDERWMSSGACINRLKPI